MSRSDAPAGLIDTDGLGSHLVVSAPAGARLLEDARALPGSIGSGDPSTCAVPALPSVAGEFRRLMERHPGVAVRPDAERLLRAVEALPATSSAVALPCEHRPGRRGVLVVQAAGADLGDRMSDVPGIRFDGELRRWWLPEEPGALDALAGILDAEPQLTAVPSVRRLVAPLVQPSLSADAVSGLEHRCAVGVTRGRLGEDRLRLCRRCDPDLLPRLAGMTDDVGRSSDAWWVALDGRSDDALAELLAEHELAGVTAEVVDAVRAAAARARESEAVERLSAATHASAVPAAVPDGLRGFQEAAVEYALSARRTFLADEPGLGKTVQALATLEAAGAFPALVVCPASLRLNWLREAQRWLPGRTAAAVDPSAGGELPDIGVVSYDVLHRIAERPADGAPRALVLDEAHLCKNPAARRTRAAAALAERLDAEAIVLLLTGTPVVNRPSELIAQLEILGRLEEIGGRRLLSSLDAGGPELAGVHRRLRRTCYVRRRKRDVLEQLPDKQRVVLPVELANRADYEEVSEDVAAWLRRHAEADAGFLASLEGLGAAERAAAVAERGRATEQRARSAETLVRLGRLSLVAARGKLPMALEWIGDFLESGEKLVVFSRHREIADAVHADVPGAALATGALDADRRAAEVERFQTDEACRLIVCTLDAAGVGLTMTAASNVAFLELAWTPAAHDQAEDRVHRIGQASAVTAWYLLAQRTIDERVTEILDRKRRVVDATSDGAGSGQASTIRELSDWLIGAPA